MSLLRRGDLTLDERFELWANKDNQQYLDIYNKLSSDSARHRLLSEEYYGCVKKIIREPYPLPTLDIDPGILDYDLDKLEIDMFKILNYQSHPHIPAPLSN